jgi:excinuclease ABC subunit A
MGVIYVLDEPSIGLHPADNERLLAQLRELRDRGNTVLVVEHDEDTMRIADEIIELGPEAGVEGGRILFQGTPAECAAQSERVSRTGPFLARKCFVEKNAKTKTPAGDVTQAAEPARTTIAHQHPCANSQLANSPLVTQADEPARILSPACKRTHNGQARRPALLTVRDASQHNLRNIDARFPVGLLTCVTGVSGSGKSTLVNDILAIAAARKLNGATKLFPGKHRGIEGLENFEKLVQVDQEPIGRSPRSNPATYTKLLDQLRDLFAQVPLFAENSYAFTDLSRIAPALSMAVDLSFDFHQP